MSIVNTREKIVNTKIVYYGPGLGGKTTSLKFVHTVLDPDRQVRMVSLKTDEERTLFFDFLPIDLGTLGGFKIKVQGYTVPGQVKYNLTRKYVLMGADAVVFVADSNPARLDENVQSMGNLRENLVANGLDPATIPMVLQLNKRDLPDALPVDELQKALSFRPVPCFATDAHVGTGVFEGFIAATEAMIEAVVQRYRLDNGGNDLSAQVRAYLGRFLTAAQSTPRS